MLCWGFLDAFTTSIGADGGVDIESGLAIAQVKSTTKKTGRPHVQRIKGVAFDGKKAFFFSLGGYTNEARMYADAAGVMLFQFGGYDGSVDPANREAHEFLRSLEKGRVGESQDEWPASVSRVAAISKAGLSGEKIEKIAGRVISSLEAVEAEHGFAVFSVSAFENRFIQCTDSGFRVESVSLPMADPPLTVGQLHVMQGLGLKKGKKKKDNFEYTFEPGTRLFEIAELILLVLLDVHGLTDEKDLHIEVGSF
jgi:hypothetical protein